MKKIFITLMCIVMVVCFMPTVAMAETVTEVRTLVELQEAISTGSNIKLVADIDIDNDTDAENGYGLVVSDSKEIYLDLNGYKISDTHNSPNHYCILVDNGSLTVDDTSSGKGGTISSKMYGILLGDDASFTLNNGKINTEEKTAVDFYTLSSNINVVINGGEISSSKDSVLAIRGMANIKVQINGGKLESGADARTGMYISSYGDQHPIDVNIAGGEFSFLSDSPSGAIQAYQGATITIGGSAKLEAPKATVLQAQNDVKLNIHGGTIITGEEAWRKPAISLEDNVVCNIEDADITSGSLYAIRTEDNSTVNITGGKFVGKEKAVGKNKSYSGTNNSKINITGGTFSSQIDSEYLPAGTQVVEKNGVFTLEPAESAVAKVGDAGFTTLQAAINAAADGQTVTLLSDVGPITETTLYIDKNLTLDLGGKTLTIDVKGIGDKNPRYSFIVNDNINFTLQNGKLKNPSGRGIFVLKNSTITVAEDAKIETAGSALVGSNNKAEEGHVTFNVYGTLDCNDIGVWGMGPNNTFNLDGATITSKYFGVYQNGSFGGCIINIKNSTITDEKEDGVAVYISNNKGNAENSKQGMQELTIENSIITGATAVEAKYTNINIKGSRTKITATGTPVNTTLNNNGPVTTGYAIAVTHNGAINKENGSVSPDSARGKITIEGGTFNGLIGIQEPLNETTKAEISISGGKFTQKLPSEYLVPGVVQNSNGTVYKPYYGGSIPTDSLKAARTEAIKAVSDYVNAADYEEAQQAEIKTIVDNAKKDIEAAKTADEIKAIEAAAKAELDKLKTAEEMALIRAIEETKFVARSKAVTLKNGKKAIKITWYDKNGKEVKFDGVEIFRSTKRYSGYGKEPIYVSKSGVYYNTAITPGTKYYYKVRGYVTIDGEKVYTDYSTKAWRTVK